MITVKLDLYTTFILMKDHHHIQNAQLKPGYNMQIGVDNKYIVAVNACYESKETYTFLCKNKQTSYIKPQTYEKWKKWSFKKDITSPQRSLNGCAPVPCLSYQRSDTGSPTIASPFP